MDAIRIEHVSKTFNSSWPGQPPVTTLRDVSLSVARGEIYGFLGPNGAGKTTTLKIILGLMRPASGCVEILGCPATDVRIRRRVGFLPESPYFYDYLTAEEFLYFYGRVAGLSPDQIRSRAPELLTQVGLQESRNKPLRKFSKGMLQRVGLAQALVHDPDLVILDEPMSGLDPIGRKEVRDLILRLRELGKTVFFSTHIIADVELICDRVGILHKGAVLATGRIEELVNQGETHSVEVVCEGTGMDQNPTLRALASKMLSQTNRYLVVLPGADRLDEALAAIRHHGGRLISVTPQKQSLEDLFMRETVGAGVWGQ
jgi:ABC-2 type transport system ATP-binding protein